MARKRTLYVPYVLKNEKRTMERKTVQHAVEPDFFFEGNPVYFSELTREEQKIMLIQVTELVCEFCINLVKQIKEDEENV